MKRKNNLFLAFIKKTIRKIRYRKDSYYYKSNFCRKKLIKAYLDNNSIAKLHIGCGKNRIAGWLNTDISIRSCKEGALYMDAGSHFPFPDNSFDYVYSEHLFEHLSYMQAINMLQECHRILKPSGVIRIATPNFRFLIDLYLNPEKPINKAYIAWSAKELGWGFPIPEHSIYIINKFHTAWGHKIIYDKESLSNMLEEDGFSNILLCRTGESDELELKNVEGHFKYMPYVYYEVETMIVEAHNDKS